MENPAIAKVSNLYHTLFQIQAKTTWISKKQLKSYIALSVPVKKRRIKLFGIGTSTRSVRVRDLTLRIIPV
ncbi:hypothetical protein EJD97_006714, partial [Solanum chilense]